MRRRLRVLIADDHPGLVRAVSRLLAMEHDVVGSVADGGALEGAIACLAPDLIVLDMNLSDVDGLEACERITQANPGIKVVVFTAMEDPDLRGRAFRAGAFAYVHKLQPVDELLSVVSRVAAGEAEPRLPEPETERIG